MIRSWHDDGWRKRFALFPIFLSDGPRKQMVWLEWVWKKDMGIFTQISLRNPRDSDEHPQDENAKRLSGEAVPARAVNDGIAQTLSPTETHNGN